MYINLTVKEYINKIKCSSELQPNTRRKALCGTDTYSVDQWLDIV